MDKELTVEQKLTTEEKVALLQAIATDSTVRSKYIRSRALQLTPLIEKQVQVRQIFTPEKLGPGANPSYPIGATEVQTAWVAPGIGSAPRRQIEGDEVYVNTFPIFARAEYLIDIAQEGRFDVVKEMEFMISNQIIELENNIGWSLIRAAMAHTSFPSAHTVQIGSTGGLDLTTGKGFFSKQLLAELILAADVARRKITDIFVSPRTMFDIFNYWTGTFGGTNQFAEISQSQYATIPGGGSNEMTMNLFGVRVHKVYSSTIVDDETVYAFDLSNERSKFGVMPITQNLITYEDPIAITEFKIGMFAREKIGFAILDHRNAFKGIIDRAA